MGKRNSIWKQFKENTRARSRAEEEYQEMLEAEEARKKEPTVANLIEMMKGFDLPTILSYKMDINDIYEALQRASQEKPIEKLELVVTVKKSGEVDECSLPMDYTIRLIADGVHIHTVYCMEVLESCLVSATASRRRLNAINSCKLFAEYVKLLIEQTGSRGHKPCLPKSYELTTDIDLSEALLDHTKFSME